MTITLGDEAAGGLDAVMQVCGCANRSGAIRDLLRDAGADKCPVRPVWP
ncbi:hypothetical protein [Roseomonas fluvialis]|nr:hypothetical protein [Roseomonas fluvialis]